METVGYVVLAVGLVVAFLYVSNRTWMKGNRWGTTNRPACRRCGTPKPVFPIRKPTLPEFVFGRWTCRTCGCKVDKHGQERRA
jgi:hypothetical protein